MSAVYVMWLREVKRFARSRSRIVGSLSQPLLFLVALGYGLGPIFRRAGQGDYFAFIVPGVISMSILFVSLFNQFARESPPFRAVMDSAAAQRRCFTRGQQ